VELPCCGYTDASAIKWNSFNGVVQCHNCGQTYTPPQRTWVGLTDDEIRLIAWGDFGVDQEKHLAEVLPLVRAIESKLKDKNHVAQEAD